MKNLPATILGISSLALTFPITAQTTNTFPTTGSVGIGTTTPGAHLHILGNDENGIKIDTINGSDNPALFFAQNGTSRWEIYAANSELRFYDYTLGAWVLGLYGGKVGIGTTSPGAALDVIRPGNANVYENGIRAHRPDSQGQYAFMGYAQSSADAYFGSVYTGSAGVYGSIHLRQYTAGMVARDALNIDSSGNVGIGTTAPDSLLTVDSADNSGVGVKRGGSPRAYLGDAGSNDGGDLLLYTAGGALSTMIRGSAASYFNGGNVGIHTTNPTHPLSVNGTIRAKEVIVDNTGWADYVFADDYRLAPLSEVESHIKSKRHLPGIPSAQEVAAHGVSMGEMQARLLGKIEELTLHLIEQEKKLRTLRAQNQEILLRLK